MKKNTLAVMLSASLLAPCLAAAAGTDPGFYAGAGYTLAKFDSSDFGPSLDLGALSVRGGYQFNQYLALEARAGTGVTDDDIQGVTVELEDMYGAYVKVGFPADYGWYPYALLGMTHAKLRVGLPGGNETNSDSDVSYGIGMDYWFNKQLSAGLEYANFYDKDGETILGLSLGVNYKF